MPKYLAFFIIFIIISSCNKEKVSMQDYTFEKEIFLSTDETFEYSLGSGMAIEGGFSIENQAKYFETSEILFNSNPNQLLQYTYKPQLGFVGDDVVILKNCISIGSGNCDKIELFKFSFHIQ